MRIVKYIFLLLLLAAIAVSVYIGTQSSDFDIQRSKVIAIDQQALFNYVDEYKNWEDWGPWQKKTNPYNILIPIKPKESVHPIPGLEKMAMEK